MKNISIHITLFTAIFFLYGYSYALSDSLPPCIAEMKISTESFVTEYKYKGQRWFVFTKINPPRENRISDKIYNTKFYDANCKLVCTWTKGGIAGFNKVTPDTIEKAKIKKIEIIQKDTIKKYLTNSNALPDTILKLALAKNVEEVKEYVYRDKILYTFHYPLYKNKLPKKDSLIIDYPYYDETGKMILVKKSAFQSMSSRAEYWQPISVYNSDVKEVKNFIWLREKNNYKKIPVSAEKAKDSIPSCINERKNMQDPTYLIEYSYKGQRWFAFSKDGSSPVSDVSDKIIYTTFYNTNCKTVCFWRKEGATGLNKATPDTVQKEEIKKIRIIPQDFIKKIPTDTLKSRNGLPYATAGLPACINLMKLQWGNDGTLTEYLYEGQRWFVFTKFSYDPEPDVPNKVTYDIFYNEYCKTAGYGKKVGGMDFSEVTPDTIQKEKIKKIRIIWPDTIQGRRSGLPDPIQKLAKMKNSNWIAEIEYQDSSIYRFQVPSYNLNSSKVTFDGPYYNAAGQEVNKPENNKYLTERSWWRYYNGTFRNTQFRPGIR